MKKTFFISDLHIGHANIIKLDNRPFSSVEEMNSAIISNWNAVVKKDDTVYVLGDMIWKSEISNAAKIISKLNGKIILIKGNHDTWLKNSAAKDLLLDVKEYADIYVELEDNTRKHVILAHYYIPFYNDYWNGAIMLHGHSHTTEEAELEKDIDKKLNINGRKLTHINVGCMYSYMNYTPRTLDELLTTS